MSEPPKTHKKKRSNKNKKEIWNQFATIQSIYHH